MLARLLHCALLICAASAMAPPGRSPPASVQLRISCPDLSSCRVNAPGAAAAVITYTPSLNSTGWDVLEVTSDAAASDAEQALAAGFGEGYATAERIGQHYRNVMALHFHRHHNASHKHAHQKIIVFLEQNLQCVCTRSSSSLNAFL